MKRIAIDVGHANGTGARGNGYEEHEVCSRLAAELKAILESFKLQTFTADIIDFPEQINSADLTSAVKAINSGNYDLCVSLHMDAASRLAGYAEITCDDGSVESVPIYEPDPVPHGAHVCYYSSNGKRLAEEIALRLCPQLPGRYEKIKRRTDLYILKKTRPVACLVECGFCTNEYDAALVKKQGYVIARAIALGIAAYF